MRELINITTYPVPHNNGTGGGGKTYVTYNNNTGINNSSANSGRMNFNSVNGGEGQFTYVLGAEGTILKLSGDELNYNFGYIGELESDKITTGQLKADDADIVKAWIETLDSKTITTEYLTVTKQAHFFELIIDKVRAVGGQIILTPAQCVADIVIARDQNGNVVNLYNSDGTLVGNISSLLNGTVKYFDVYFRNEDELGHGIDNEWVEHDQAFCQSFNVTEGVHHDIANKYYWRHVDAVLPNKMVNFTTKELKDIGDTLTSTNNITIKMAQTKGESLPNGITWQATAQSIQGIQSTVQWNDISGSSGNAIDGVMKTDSTALGIEIKPTSDNKYYMTKELTFMMKYSDTSIAPEGMKVGVYYTDGTSQYFSNLTFDGNCMTTLHLDCDHPIEAIVIVCTQPVQWHQCHAIRLSNTNMDEMLSPKASIPEPGDSIVQLGYQATGPDDPNAEVDGYSRQSAIIIAAYHTPDHELTAPSYAQYMKINDYNLSTHRGSYIDGKGAEFLGDIRLAKVAYDENGNAINMSEFVLDEKQIKTTVSELIITENNHYQENVTHITQNANAISLEAQRRENGDTTLQANINIQADRISSEVRDRQNADIELSSSITQSATEIKSWVGRQDYATNSSVSSQISQQADRITAEVTARQNADRELSASITMTATEIKSWVGRQNYTTGSDVSSMISQSATSITAQVTENIEGKLIETGIDIDNRTITLKSDKVYFTPSSNNATWIQGVTADRSRVFALGQYEGSSQPALYLPENPGGSGTICMVSPGYLQLGNGTMITADGSTSVFKMETRNDKKFSITLNSSGYVMIDGTNGHSGRRYLYVDGDGYLKLDDDAHVF